MPSPESGYSPVSENVMPKEEIVSNFGNPPVEAPSQEITDEQRRGMRELQSADVEKLESKDIPEATEALMSQIQARGGIDSLRRSDIEAAIRGGAELACTVENGVVHTDGASYGWQTLAFEALGIPKSVLKEGSKVEVLMPEGKSHTNVLSKAIRVKIDSIVYYEKSVAEARVTELEQYLQSIKRTLASGE